MKANRSSPNADEWPLAPGYRKGNSLAREVLVSGGVSFPLSP